MTVYDNHEFYFFTNTHTYMKSRATRVRSTMKGKNLLLGLFLVTSGGLECF